MQSITPGANLFSSGSFWVYAIMGGLFFINIFMFIQGSACIRLFAQVSKIPQSIMTPCIVVMCMMGAFAINNNIFECFVTVSYTHLALKMALQYNTSLRSSRRLVLY